MIGNGFDLNVGLKTSFKDVSKIYLNSSSDKPYINEFKKEIKEYPDLWSYFEKQFGLYAEKFSLKNVDEYHDCLKDFRGVLINHLRQEESRINYDLHEDEIISVFKNSIMNVYSSLEDESKNIISSLVSPHTAVIYNFITFNYTNILEKCLSLLKPSIFTRKTSLPTGQPIAYQDSRGEIIYIHGTTGRSPIIGVDNEKQINNTELIQDDRFKKKIIKPIENDNSRNSKNEKTKGLILNSQVIIIFGMALGETDGTWWIQIVQWLKNRNNHHLVIFIYDPVYNPINIEDKIDIEENAMLQLFRISGVEQELGNYRQQIHISINSDIFKINLVNENENIEIRA
ncbi:AbiH family protein [Treponema endosymbiont of Eucomonympha sp.]|uniref:AbiH family protein n=1 Tax=Treponema endosymbiont of Eucomonympha sp. TaxID=1580831 RepID=UPI00164F3797|nr:AbiH family protein [Treponema endosymbiont of Eucomonympha sp.]